MPEPNSGCWLWLGHLSRKGYARAGFRRAGKMIVVEVHRLAHEAFTGPIPTGAFVCHHCDNAACVNPEHLYAGTAATNVADMIRRGRHRGMPQGGAGTRFSFGNTKGPRGETHHSAKLTPQDVLAIRASKAGQRDLGRAYGVCRSTISAIRAGKIWRSLPTGSAT
jgi:hypothetical protein